MAQRHFTRRDIEAFFNTNWSQFETEHMSFELQAIGLYSETDLIMWRVEYFTITTYDNGSCTYHYCHTTIVEKESAAGPYLTVLVASTLPDNCASVQEEDAELARRLAEFRTQHAGE